MVPHPLLRFRLPTVLLGLILLYGTLGYRFLEHWNLLDAFYMTLITISTVGYGEVHPLSAAGKLFTSTLIMGGVGTLLYSPRCVITSSSAAMDGLGPGSPKSSRTIVSSTW